MENPIILASTSAIRQELLVNAGVRFTTASPELDERGLTSSMLDQGLSGHDIAITLAKAKARNVAAKNPGAIVIGADQVLQHDGRILGKPRDMAAARDQIIQLTGSEHRLISAAVIVKNDQTQWQHAGQTRLWMRQISENYLDEYLDRLGPEALTTAGSYKLEQEGVRLFSRIEGDYFTVLGIPLVELLNYLTETGLLDG